MKPIICGIAIGCVAAFLLIIGLSRTIDASVERGFRSAMQEMRDPSKYKIEQVGSNYQVRFPGGQLVGTHRALTTREEAEETIRNLILFIP